MGKRDYTRFSNGQKNQNEIRKPEEVPEVKVESVPKVEDVVKPCFGVVTNCQLLNVRREAKPDAEIVSTLPCDMQVEIDEAQSTDDYYKVCNSAGIEGFCMKKYIEVKE